MIKPDMSYLGFEDIARGIMCYNHEEKKIEICTSRTYSIYEESIIEREIEAIISHETMHAVIDYRESVQTSGKYDNLGEAIGHTPYSFPS